eukprot:624133-Amphidinium_carterae.1
MAPAYSPQARAFSKNRLVTIPATSQGWVRSPTWAVSPWQLCHSFNTGTRSFAQTRSAADRS